MAKGKTTSKASKLVQECLATLDVLQESFSGCSTLDEEWKVIKKAYFAKILVSHPDKGGDAAVFREVQTSFESIRQLYDSKKISSFATSGIHDVLFCHPCITFVPLPSSLLYLLL